MSSPSAPPLSEAAPRRRSRAGTAPPRRRPPGPCGASAARAGLRGRPASPLACGGALTADNRASSGRAAVLALFLVVRAGWLPLVGPVFSYDFIRTTRRGRYAVLRAVYAALLFLFILALYRCRPRPRPRRLAAGRRHHVALRRDVLLHLPRRAVPGRRRADARLRRRCHCRGEGPQDARIPSGHRLRDREIVLGKMAARVCNLVLLLLTGLPILSLTQLWGGVDFGVLLSCVCQPVLTLLSLAAVSMVASVYSRTAREAVVLAYLVAAGYVGIRCWSTCSTCSRACRLAHAGGAFPGNDVESLGPCPTRPGPGDRLRTVGDRSGRPVGAGNTGLFCLGLRDDLRSGMTLQAVADRPHWGLRRLPAECRCRLHRLGGVRLRPLALLEPREQAKPAAKERVLAVLAARGRGRALLWKEVWAEPGLTFNWFGKAILLLIVLASLVPAIWLIGDLPFWSAECFAEFNIPELGQLRQLWVAYRRHAGRLPDSAGGGGARCQQHQRRARPADLRQPALRPDRQQQPPVRQVAGQRAERSPGLAVAVLVWLLGGATGGLYGRPFRGCSWPGACTPASWPSSACGSP